MICLITVLILFSSISTSALSVQDSSFGVVWHWVVNSADIRKEVKVLQDMFWQFDLGKKIILFLKLLNKRSQGMTWI